MASARRCARGRLEVPFIGLLTGSSEDPANGAHEAFPSEVLDVAYDIRRFTERSTMTDTDIPRPELAAVTTAPKEKILLDPIPNRLPRRRS